jgi:hypothetical protein
MEITVKEYVLYNETTGILDTKSYISSPNNDIIKVEYEYINYLLALNPESKIKLISTFNVRKDLSCVIYVVSKPAGLGKWIFSDNIK